MINPPAGKCLKKESVPEVTKLPMQAEQPLKTALPMQAEQHNSDLKLTVYRLFVPLGTDSLFRECDIHGFQPQRVDLGTASKFRENDIHQFLSD